MTKNNHRKPVKRKLLALILIFILGVAFFNYKNEHSAPQDPKTADNKSSQQAVKAKIIMDEGLQRIIDDWTKQRDEKASVYVQELINVSNLDLREASHNKDEPMIPASAYKVYLAYAVMHSIEKGSLSMATETQGGQTIEQCLNEMIINSDNVCANNIGLLIGWDKANQMLKEIGLTSTDLNNYDSSGERINGNKETTAADMTIFLKKLYEGAILNDSDTNKLIELMKQQVRRERIPAGLPADVEVASKPGWLGGVQTDAGIVYGQKSIYLIVIFTNESYPEPLADLSKNIYDYLNLVEN